MKSIVLSKQRTSIVLIIWTIAILMGCSGSKEDVILFSDLTANGESGLITTTELTLSFDKDPTSLSIGDITVTGATKGAVSGSGITRTLEISDITVSDGEAVTVELANPPLYKVTPNSKTVNIHKMLIMVDIPAGTFQRDGTAENTSAVSGFMMSAKEITRIQFLTIMGTDPSVTTYSGGVNDPVQLVSWYDAIAFCNKLSIAEGLQRVYDIEGITGDADWEALTYDEIPTTMTNEWNMVTANWSANGYRLPTEMEWMWAAMGADQDSRPGAIQNGINRTGYSKAFAGSSGSNTIGDYAVFGYHTGSTGRTIYERTISVGSKLPNELGLFDMSGNVWEWAWDNNEFLYPTGHLTDYRGYQYVPGEKIKRGGDWRFDESYCTVALRKYNNVVFKAAYNGFRVARY
ncbi:MAG: SUMF1/EgtB/PvdO family nonheme iron enzyme [Bacteroidales bacterium]